MSFFETLIIGPKPEFLSEASHEQKQQSASTDGPFKSIGLSSSLPQSVTCYQQISVQLTKKKKQKEKLLVIVTIKRLKGQV